MVAYSWGCQERKEKIVIVSNYTQTLSVLAELCEVKLWIEILL